MMYFLTEPGPFCRDCGIATFRRMTATTLVDGWWGMASAVITPVTAFINLGRRRAVTRLPPPEPPASGPWRRPMEHGRPVLRRLDVLFVVAFPTAAVLAAITIMIMGLIYTA